VVKAASSIIYEWSEIIHDRFNVAVLLYSYKVLSLP
jgi:hypothetical protein